MTDHKQKNGRLSDLVGVATGGNAFAIEQLQEATPLEGVVSRDAVIQILREYGIPYAKVVREDLNRIYSGQRPRYFVVARKMAKRYRDRRGIYDWRPEGGLLSAADIVDELEKDLDEAKREQEEYGAHQWLYRMGIACYREQEDFYQSREWSDRAAVIRASYGFSCQRCGRSNTELHAHHLTPIYSAYSKKFHRNFNTADILCWCADCHRDYHAQSVRTEFGFTIASNEEVLEEREENRKRRIAHDKTRTCRYCKKFVWND